MLRYYYAFLLAFCFFTSNVQAASIEEINRFEKLITEGDVVKCTTDFSVTENNEKYQLSILGIMKVIYSVENEKRYHTTQYYRLNGSTISFVRHEMDIIVTHEKSKIKEVIVPDSVKVFYPLAPEQEAILAEAARKTAPVFIDHEDITFTTFPDYQVKVKYPSISDVVTQYCRVQMKK
ncbi:hypothetical protein RCV49_08615 [Escherichia marmotae]|nr:hypothetical protein [Escherichia marmotae]MED0544566.1 hypothetical protein [Escherichia marmotae]